MTANHSRNLIDMIDKLAKRVADLEGSRALGAQPGPWTPYSVAWTASGTAPSLGSNGLLLGAYSKMGRVVHVRIGLYGGSGTTWGSGVYALSLPFTANVAGVPGAQFAASGSILLAAAGNTTFYTLGAVIDKATPSVVNGVVNSNANLWSQGVPAALGTTAQAVISLTYESVS